MICSSAEFVQFAKEMAACVERNQEAVRHEAVRYREELASDFFYHLLVEVSSEPLLIPIVIDLVA